MRHLPPRDHGYRIGNSASRTTIVQAPDDTKVIQEHTIDGYQDESHAGIEAFTNYGFTSVPQPPTGQGAEAQTAEAMTVYLGSNRSHGVIIAHGDRRYRLYKLQNGEVAMHDDQGQQVHFRRDGLWSSVPNSKKIVLQVMQSDKLPQDGNQVNGQTLGQVQQAGQQAVSTVTIDKSNLTVTVPGTITLNAANIALNASQAMTLIAGGNLNNKGAKVFTVGETHLGVDNLNEVVKPIVPDVDLNPSKQTHVKIA